MLRAVLLACLACQATGQCAPGACMENGDRDGDCCGMEGSVYCADGFSLSLTAGNGCWWNGGTCCTPQVVTPAMCASMPASCESCLPYRICVVSDPNNEICPYAPAHCGQTCQQYAYCFDGGGTFEYGVYGNDYLCTQAVATMTILSTSCAALNPALSLSYNPATDPISVYAFKADDDRVCIMATGIMAGDVNSCPAQLARDECGALFELDTCWHNGEQYAKIVELSAPPESVDTTIIIVIVVAAVCGLLLVVLGVWCYCKKGMKKANGATSAVQGVAMPAQPAVQSQPQQQGKTAKLKELKELLDAGVLTQDEFDSQKKEVLAGNSCKV